ncbi:MAG: NAD(P)H-dependent oxidoreductase [Bacteroidia bacterium]|nr:NAD(P)H-dependent oxidoreductase [Bacteroidia bacterium]
MIHLSILSSSIRTDRKSHWVALFFKQFIEEQKLATVEVLDLNEFNFPLFNERLKFQKEPSAKAIEFAEKIKKTDGLIIVTPEYNGGYPASLKNAIDLIYDEWHRKPVAISTVSAGDFGGSQVVLSLQSVLWKMHALVSGEVFPVPKVAANFNAEGTPADKEKIEKRAKKFIDELLWLVNAKKKMEGI